MKKIFMYQSLDGKIPFEEFIKKQDKKLQKKVGDGLKCMALFPEFMKEPHVKHFTIERYNRLHEYRERIKIMVRIIFTYDENGDIILLYPFVKKQERDTMKALEMSVKLFSDIENGNVKLTEYKGENRK